MFTRAGYGGRPSAVAFPPSAEGAVTRGIQETARSTTWIGLFAYPVGNPTSATPHDHTIKPTNPIIRGVVEPPDQGTLPGVMDSSVDVHP
jgi:hypothetical protein